MSINEQGFRLADDSLSHPTRGRTDHFLSIFRSCRSRVKISKEQRAGDWDVWQTSLHNPDFSRYAEICGAFGVRVADSGQLDDALKDAIAHDPPALVGSSCRWSLMG